MRLIALLSAAAAVAGVAGCATDPPPPRSTELGSAVRAELQAQSVTAPAPRAAAAPAPEPAPAPVPAPAAPAEPRFDLIVTGAQARDVFLSIVGDTRYSMLMHPDVAGTLSVTLRAVTVKEALEAIRDVYGYDFRIDGRRITVYPASLQTRIFTVNYIAAQRRGKSEVRVGSTGAPAAAPSTNGNVSTAAPTPDNSQITTLSNSDFWTETADALRGLLGKGEGRAVITSPQSGTIAVRALPDELRQVDNFLRASQLAVERQVMLEAKIVEVELREGFQSGIDWSLLRSRGAIGQSSGLPGNALVANDKGLPTLPAAVAGLLLDAVSLPAAGGGALGLTLATKGFQAVLGFLETHGDLQILSSPRIATLNNQKAVLKVGTDEYFVTNVSGGSITPSNNNNSNNTTTLPTITLTPFFSGVALDVTPQIDDSGMITLHLRPSVTLVTEKTKQIDLGTIGNYRLPLASSSVNETDTIVRVPDGNIVAIGGLMQSETTRRNSGVPGSNGNVVTRHLLGNNTDTGRKKELVVLIKPTVIRGGDDWQRVNGEALASFVDSAPVRTIVVKPGAGSADTHVTPAPLAQAAASPAR